MDILENWRLVVHSDIKERHSPAIPPKLKWPIRRVAEFLVDVGFGILSIHLAIFCLEGQRNVDGGHEGSAIIKTPPIVSRNADGTAVMTQGGVWYELGEPNPKSAQRALNSGSKFLASLPVIQNPIPAIDPQMQRSKNAADNVPVVG